MRIQIILVGLLFLMNIRNSCAQNSALLLKINQSGLNNLELECELKNISNDTIEIDHFYSNSNTFTVEKPNGKVDGLGYISCGINQKKIDVYPDSLITWKLNLYDRFFEPPFVIRPRKNGTYKFYWYVNGTKSKAIVYEYVRKE